MRGMYGYAVPLLGADAPPPAPPPVMAVPQPSFFHRITARVTDTVRAHPVISIGAVAGAVYFLWPSKKRRGRR